MLRFFVIGFLPVFSLAFGASVRGVFGVLLPNGPSDIGYAVSVER